MARYRIYEVDKNDGQKLYKYLYEEDGHTYIVQTWHPQNGIERMSEDECAEAVKLILAANRRNKMGIKSKKFTIEKV